MRKLGCVTLAIVVAMVLACAPGCGNNGNEYSTNPSGWHRVGGGQAGPKLTEVQSTGWGKIVGRVSYDGDPPASIFATDMRLKNKDAKTCFQRAEGWEKRRQEWIVTKGSNGVADVVVYIQKPKNQFFKIHDDDKNRKDKKHRVIVDQPHCHYIPHVVTVFPVYYSKDESGNKVELRKTGQEFIVKNSSDVGHNAKFEGGNAKYGSKNPDSGVMYPTQHYVVNDNDKIRLYPQPNPVRIGCSIHNWMQAYAFAFDHPYHAVTKGSNLKDNEADWGKFEIPRVPAGVELQLKIWHDGPFTVTAPGNLDAQNGMKISPLNDKEERQFDIKIVTR